MSFIVVPVIPWGGVEGWGEKAYNCNWITIKKKYFLKYEIEILGNEAIEPRTENLKKETELAAVEYSL